jgi:hypothetical protein
MLRGNQLVGPAKRVRLTPTELEVLRKLMAAGGRAVALARWEVWHVGNLRRKLGEAGLGRDCIVTEPGWGHAWVTREAGESQATPTQANDTL